MVIYDSRVVQENLFMREYIKKPLLVTRARDGIPLEPLRVTLRLLPRLPAVIGRQTGCPQPRRQNRHGFKGLGSAGHLGGVLIL